MNLKRGLASIMTAMIVAGGVIGESSVYISQTSNSLVYAAVAKPASTSITSVSAGVKCFSVVWKKQAKNTNGYQIQYSTSSGFQNSKNISITSNKTTSTKISNLTGNKKYYVRVRTYRTVNGKKYYSVWSKSKTVTTKTSTTSKWASAYISKLTNDIASQNNYNYQLIYVSNDNIPEIYVESTQERISSMMLSYANGNVKSAYCGNGSVRYVEKGCYFLAGSYISAGRTGLSYMLINDKVMSIDSKEFTTYATGSYGYSTTSKIDPKWNNQSVSEATYNANIKKYINLSKAKNSNDAHRYTYSQILNKLKGM